MKKGWSLLLCLALLFMAAGCANNGENASSRTRNQAPGVKEVLEAETAKDGSGESTAEPGGVPAPETAESEPQENETTDVPEAETAGLSGTAKEGGGTADVDLTVLPGTMVYAEVYHMLSSPEEYIGKTVKMSGTCSIYVDDTTKQYYYACIIADATACCAQGIEFVLAEDYAFPEAYPDAGTDVCVTGVFDTYEENGNTYCTLRNAKLV